ncbi:MAG: hypothetical protein HY906_05400 [Deltaproteobacteria bacterium]|nr:hypothetical protein [Deltaproteobacteria bacterium]
MAATSSTASRTSTVTWISIFAALALGASTVYFAALARAVRRAAADAKAAGAAGAVAAAPAGADDRGTAAGVSDEVRRLRAENLALVRRLLEQEAGGAAARPRRPRARRG